MMRTDCIVLNYHEVLPAPRPEADPVYAVSESQFKSHLALVAELGLSVVTLEDVFSGEWQGESCVCFTFDDGFLSDNQIVAPALAERGMRGCFFPTIKNIPAQDPHWKNYANLAQQGHTIGAHGVTHQYLNALKPHAQRYELESSRKIVSEKSGRPVDFFSLPGGKYNAQLVDLAKEMGFKALLTTDFGHFSSENPPFLMPRWSIRKSTSLAQLRGVLMKEPATLRKLMRKKRLRKNIAGILGNRLTDQLNYLIASR